MLLIDVPSNESQFSSSNTTLFGFEMQGPSITSSQFGQPSIVAPANQNINVVGNSSFQLPAWAKDSNSIIVPDPSSFEVYSKYASL